MDNYSDLVVFRQNQFTLGFDHILQQYFVSFYEPTPHRLSDYKVLYALKLDYLPISETDLKSFVEECRLGKHQQLKYKNC